MSLNLKITRRQNGKALERLVKDARALSVRVGWFESSKYPDGTPVAMVAAIHEFGAPEGGIPARPFFRTAVIGQKKEWRDSLGNLLAQSLDGAMDVPAAFNGVGTLMAADVKMSITDASFEPLKPATLHRRKTRKNPPPTESDAVLRDTLRMFTTLTHAVVPRGAA